MRRWMIAGIVAALLVAAWAWFAREEVSDSASDAPIAGAPGIGSAATPASIPAKAVRFEASRAPAATARMPTPAAPLPPEDAPLAEPYDALAARARAGDNAAAMRLAFDLTRCRNRAGADADTLRELDAGKPPVEDAVSARMNAGSRRRIEESLAKDTAFCRSVAPEQVEARGEWLLMAAERGDGEAMVCYAARPDSFAPPLFSDAWFDWSRRWRERATTYADEAYAQGRLDILLVLAEVHSGQTFAGAPISTYALAPITRADRVRGAAYTDIARRVGRVGPRSLDDPYAELDEEERVRAQALANRDAGRFTVHATGRADLHPCRRLIAARSRGTT